MFFAGPIHTHTWISQIHATLAQPSPLGPSTWPLPTRTNYGSFAARATWSRAKRVLETCSEMAQDAGEDIHYLFDLIQVTLSVCSILLMNQFTPLHLTKIISVLGISLVTQSIHNKLSTLLFLLFMSPHI